MHWLAALPAAAAAGEQRWCTNAGAKMAVISCHAVMLHLPTVHLRDFAIVHLPIDTSHRDSPSSKRPTAHDHRDSPSSHRHFISLIIQPTSHREWQSIFSS